MSAHLHMKSLYNEKKHRITTMLFNFANRQITNHTGSTIIWINLDDTIDAFENSYINIFMEEFKDYMDIPTHYLIRSAGRHLVYSLRISVRTEPHITDDILCFFAKQVIFEQIEDIDNWCHSIGEYLGIFKPRILTQ